MYPYIVNDILDVLPYLGNALTIAMVMSLLYIILNKKNHNFSWRRVAAYFLFFTYVIIMIEIALLSREPGSRLSMDLKPFSTWGNSGQSHAYVIENILFFLPMGFFLPILFQVQKRVSVMVCTAFLCSLSIETVQKLTQRGYFQTDDMITNVLGAVIGYLFWKLLINKRRKKD